MINSAPKLGFVKKMQNLIIQTQSMADHSRYNEFHRVTCGRCKWSTNSAGFYHHDGFDDEGHIILAKKCKAGIEWEDNPSVKFVTPKTTLCPYWEYVGNMFLI